MLHIRSKYLHTPPSSRRPDLFQRLTRLRRRRLQRLAQRDGRRDIKARRNGSLELAAEDLLDSATGGDVGCFSNVDGLLVDLVVSVWLCTAGEGMQTGPVGMLLRGCRLVERRETGGKAYFGLDMVGCGRLGSDDGGSGVARGVMMRMTGSILNRAGPISNLIRRL